MDSTLILPHPNHQDSQNIIVSYKLFHSVASISYLITFSLFKRIISLDLHHNCYFEAELFLSYHPPHPKAHSIELVLALFLMKFVSEW